MIEGIGLEVGSIEERFPVLMRRWVYLYVVALTLYATCHEEEEQCVLAPVLAGRLYNRVLDLYP